MLEQLLNHIAQYRLCERSDKVLLAVSGGIDSIVLLHLFQQAGFSIGVAHCNFQLRGKESDEEEIFVKSICDVHAIPFHVKRFNTEAFAEEKGLSIQLAARELRYAFFNELLQQHEYKCVATAHHHNDNLETVLLHLVRGTGIDGMAGIPVKNGNIIRPLLFATRQNILQYAMAKQLDWREDSSNKNDDYHRNFLRHNIIPLLKNINPGLEESFKDTLERMQGARAFTSLTIQSIKEKNVLEKNNEIRIDKAAIKRNPFSSVLLWEMIKEFGFRYDQCKQISAPHQPGKIFTTQTHQLTVDREHFIITTLAERSEVRTYTIQAGEAQALFDKYRMELNEISVENFALKKDAYTAQLDAEKIEFPLTWRYWRSGDFFHPLGMNHTKKLSDFFIDLKIPLPNKEHITVLESKGEIVWVVGLRISDRFKVSDKTKRVLTIQLAEE